MKRNHYSFYKTNLDAIRLQSKINQLLVYSDSRDEVKNGLLVLFNQITTLELMNEYCVHLNLEAVKKELNRFVFDKNEETLAFHYIQGKALDRLTCLFNSCSDVEDQYRLLSSAYEFKIFQPIHGDKTAQKKILLMMPAPPEIINEWQQLHRKPSLYK